VLDRGLEVIHVPVRGPQPSADVLVEVRRRPQVGDLARVTGKKLRRDLDRLRRLA